MFSGFLVAWGGGFDGKLWTSQDLPKAMYFDATWQLSQGGQLCVLSFGSRTWATSFGIFFFPLCLSFQSAQQNTAQRLRVDDCPGSAKSFLRQAAPRLLEAPSERHFHADDFTLCAQADRGDIVDKGIGQRRVSVGQTVFVSFFRRVSFLEPLRSYSFWRVKLPSAQQPQPLSAGRPVGFDRFWSEWVWPTWWVWAAPACRAGFPSSCVMSLRSCAKQLRLWGVRTWPDTCVSMKYWILGSLFFILSCCR